jgi:predicted DNA binding CopG/RHH family protein
MKLDKEELELLESYEAEAFRRVQDFKTERARLESAAWKTLRKDRRINIRISSRDLEMIQKKAIREGLPYQTLISSVLHRYVNGKQQDVEQAPGPGA